MILRRLLVIGSLSVASLNLPAFAQQQSPLRDGSWTGHTSQSKMISFRIEAGTVRVFDLDWTMQFDQVCPGRAGSSPSPSRIERGEIVYFHPKLKGHEPPRIQLSAFTFSREVETPEVPVTVVLSGRFGTDSTVTGEMTLTATGCPGREAITWQAGRKAAPVGESAPR